MGINIYEVTYVNNGNNKNNKELESMYGISMFATYAPNISWLSNVKIAANSFDDAYKKAKKHSKDEIKKIEFKEEIEI